MQDNIKIGILLFLLSLASFGTVVGQAAHKNLRSGDMLYGFGKYNDAETEYRKADIESPSVKSSYNLANTLMNQERYDEAAKKYEEAAAKANSNDEKSMIYHNQGNAYFNKQQYKESVDAFKKSLKYNTKDIATKENLAMAQYELKKQIQQQKQEQQKQEQQKDQNKDQNKDQQKDQQDQQNNKDDIQDQQDQQDQKDQKNDAKDQEDKNKSEQEENENNKNGEAPDKNMSKEDAQKLLEIMDNEEKKVQQKLRRIDGKGKKPKKDW